MLPLEQKTIFTSFTSGQIPACCGAILKFILKNCPNFSTQQSHITNIYSPPPPGWIPNMLRSGQYRTVCFCRIYARFQGNVTILYGRIKCSKSVTWLILTTYQRVFEHLRKTGNIAYKFHYLLHDRPKVKMNNKIKRRISRAQTRSIHPLRWSVFLWMILLNFTQSDTRKTYW